MPVTTSHSSSTSQPFFKVYAIDNERIARHQRNHPPLEKKTTSFPESSEKTKPYSSTKIAS
ncbi:MAG: hypothetical protein LAT55_09760 [Opitutales bacterium]|nr:hypothetical protein [Opitutales bacterium]